MAGNKRLEWIGIANVCSCISVIYLHCNVVFWSFPKGRLWYTSNFIETFFYWAVPVFFMISGATLLDYRDRYTTVDFFKRRMLRTMIPFLFWGGFSAFYRFTVSKWETEGIIDIALGILNTKYCTIYWFFITLFSLYLSIPLLSLVPKKLREMSFLYLSIVAFVFNSLLPLAFELLNWKYNSGLRIPVAENYLIYILLGYLIANTDIPRKYRILIYIMGALGWFAHFYGTTVLSFQAGKIATTFKGYTKAPAILHSIAVMVAFRYIDWNILLKSRGGVLIQWLSKYSLGIYCIHYYLVMLIPVVFGFDSTRILWRVIGPAVIFCLSLIAAIILSKVPALKRIIVCKKLMRL